MEGRDCDILKCCSLRTSSVRDKCMYCAAQYVLLAPTILVVKFSVVCLYLRVDNTKVMTYNCYENSSYCACSVRYSVYSQRIQ